MQLGFSQLIDRPVGRTLGPLPPLSFAPNATRVHLTVVQCHLTPPPYLKEVFSIPLNNFVSSNSVDDTAPE